MLLVEEGLVCINRPVVEYVPELSGKGTENILVFHLLTHSSGFDCGLTSDVEIEAANAFKEQRTRERLEIPPVEPTQHEWIHLLLNARYALDPVHAPGEVMSYCNHNYVLLGEIVRRVSGMAFEDFAHKRIFEPLGMHNSSFRLEEEFRSRIVKRHPATFIGLACWSA